MQRSGPGRRSHAKKRSLSVKTASGLRNRQRASTQGWLRSVRSTPSARKGACRRGVEINLLETRRLDWPWKKNNSGAPKESTMNAKKKFYSGAKNAKNARSQKFTERDVVDENSSKEWYPKMKTRPK